MIKLILVRRNEAICCLIGFSIGIGCCLMYRWIRNTFFSLEFRNSYPKVTNSNGEETKNASLLVKLNNKIAGRTHPATSNLFRSSSTSHYDHSSNANLLFDTSWPNQADLFYNKKPTSNFKYRANSARSSNRNYFTNRVDPFSSRGSSKQRSFDYYSSSNNTSKSQSQSRYSSSYNLNTDFINNCYEDPLNDVYQNLAKFLNKQFCKTFKLRHRASLNKKYNKSANYFDFFNNNNNNNNNNKTTNVKRSDIYPSFASVKPQNPQPNQFNTSTNPLNQNKLFNNFNLNIKKNSSDNNSSDYYKNDEINSSFDDKSSIKSNSSIAFDDDYDLTQTNPGDEITMTEKYNNGASQYISKKIDNDNMSMDSFMTDDPLNESSKLLFPTESVDKSLDEALHHIDMLKEDMSHLCKDIDTLYNTKINDKTNLLNDYSSSQLSLNKLLNRNQNQQSTHHSSNSSLVNNNDEINDVIKRYKLSLESNQFKKCCCIYSDMITMFNLDKNNFNNENIYSDEIIYYDDKYAQTNVDHFLSTPSMSTSTSTSTSFNRFSLLNRRNTNANIIASNKYSRRRYFLTNRYTKKPNGLYVLSTSPSMTTSSSLNYCSLTQKKRVPKKSKILLHR
jgi:hypothetical protein